MAAYEAIVKELYALLGWKYTCTDSDDDVIEIASDGKRVPDVVQRPHHLQPAALVCLPFQFICVLGLVWLCRNVHLVAV